jgi:hypothetical protein
MITSSARGTAISVPRALRAQNFLCWLRIGQPETINSFDLALTALGTAYSAPPFPALSHAPIELAGSRQVAVAPTAMRQSSHEETRLGCEVIGRRGQPPLL